MSKYKKYFTQLTDFIKSQDDYGRSLDMNYEGQEVINTTCGGACTICTILLFTSLIGWQVEMILVFFAYEL